MTSADGNPATQTRLDKISRWYLRVLFVHPEQAVGGYRPHVQTSPHQELHSQHTHHYQGTASDGTIDHYLSPSLSSVDDKRFETLSIVAIEDINFDIVIEIYFISMEIYRGDKVKYSKWKEAWSRNKQKKSEQDKMSQLLPSTVSSV
jgi:hypothetical protein